ncbi:MAG: secretin N-terminal domain-containing protein [Edaphobacter sp.]
MRFAIGFMGAVAALGLIGQSARAQTTEKPAATPVEKPAIQQDPNGHVDTRPMQSFHLTNINSQNEANEVTVAVRNLLDPNAKLYLVPSQNMIVMRGSTEQIAMAQKIINELDRPKKLYRLTYTITEIDGGKRVGVQHFSMVLTDGQRTVMKQGNKVPIVTGSYNNTSSQAESQVTFIDVGMNFDATLDSYGGGARLKSKVEQLGMTEEKSGVGPQYPIIRQTALEGTALLAPGKPVVLGSLDVPGSTRHLDVDVMMEPVAQ